MNDFFAARPPPTETFVPINNLVVVRDREEDFL